MTSPSRALYFYAWEERRMEEWLFDNDGEKEYRESLSSANEREKELRDMLGGDGRKTLQELLDSLLHAYDMENEMSFNRGVAVGLKLAGMAGG